MEDSKEIPKNTGRTVDEANTGDVINSPSHYRHSGLETIDVIEDWELGYHEGNVIKYLSRWKKKGGVEDLKKAQWYLQRLIDSQVEDK